MDEIEKQVELEQIKEGEYKEYAALLLLMATTIRTTLSTPIQNRADLESRIVTISNQLAQIKTEYNKQLMLGLNDLATVEATNNLFKEIDKAIAQSSINGIPVLGTPLPDYIRKWDDATISAITSRIRQSYFEGQSQNEIIDTIVGTKELGFKDGSLYTVQNYATAEISTLIQSVAMYTALTALSDGDKYQWVSVLDGRTSQICRSRSGMIFTKGQGPIPPAHRRCRSSIRPVSPSNYEPTYYEWLKQQPLSFQERVIGKQMTKVFNDKNMTSKKFAKLQLDKRFMPVKGGLKALRQLHPSAFKNI